MKKIRSYLQKLFPLILLLCAGLGAGLLAPGQAQAGETITYIHADIAGSPIAATNAAGNLLWKESYRPYGARSQNTDQGKHAQWFTGKPLEASTGLSYFGARYYDPVVGRFMGVDPVGFMENNLHSFNRYAYGNNNPSRYLDPDGNLPVLIPIAAAYVFGNVAIGAGFDYAFQKALGQTVNWGQVAFGGFAGGMLGGAGGVGASAVMNSAKATSYAAKATAQETVTLYRGVATSHPGYANALKGIAEPRGGHVDSILHSLGDTKSAFTSWTTDINIARGFATNGGKEAGALLTKVVSKDSTVSVPANVQIMMGEAEVLIQGTVRGANVIPVW
jgi:RHS repeat-associated protein